MAPSQGRLEYGDVLSDVEYSYGLSPFLMTVHLLCMQLVNDEVEEQYIEHMLAVFRDAIEVELIGLES